MSSSQDVAIAAPKLSFAGALALALGPRAKAPATTLGNLQVAFNEESNAHARYLAFAEQAQQEGYAEIASLFRAAARAERIHATNHAAVIEELGALPKPLIEAPTVKSTRENLEAAIKGETYEREIMYPDLIKQAAADSNSHAVETLNLARAAEAEHARLFAAALANLDHLKGSKNVTYYVCPVCGYTARDTNFSKCPSCFTSKTVFESVA